MIYNTVKQYNNNKYIFIIIYTNVFFVDKL